MASAVSAKDTITQATAGTRRGHTRLVTGAAETRADLRERLEAAGEDLTPPAERAAREDRAPRTRAQILSVLDPGEAACRGQEHGWPRLDPDAAELPRGMTVRAAGQGCVLITEDCLHDCGRYRETLTGPRGIYDSGASRRYGTRPGYRHTVIHRDEKITKADIRKGTFDSNAALFRRAAKAATAAAKTAAS